MSLQEMMPWRWGGLRRWSDEPRPMGSIRREFTQLQNEMERLFEDFWRTGGRGDLLPARMTQGELMPEVDQSEDDKAYHVRIELPGLDKKDVDVSLSDSRLTIRGEKKQDEEEKGKDYYRRECSFGTFVRTLPIPGEVNESKIKASFDKGILSIDLPKSETAQKKVKHIDISTAA